MAQRRRRKKAAGEAPTSDCVLLCDDVLVSQGTHKHSLLGVIGGITVARGFPAVLGGYVAYARFSNVYAGQKITIKLISASTEESVLETEIAFPAQSDPLGVYTLVTKVPPFVVKEPGRYLFGAYHNGIPVAASPIEIIGPAKEDEP